MNAENEVFEVPAQAAAPIPAAANSTPNPTPMTPPQPLSPGDERLWAMLAHLSVLLNLVTGFLGVAAALIIYLVYRDRSRYVAFQALQALIFQLVFWAGGGVLIGLMWAIVGALSAVLIGILLIPFALIGTLILACFPLIALIYGIVGALQTNGGKDFRYWLVGDWALNLLV